MTLEFVKMYNKWIDICKYMCYFIVVRGITTIESEDKMDIYESLLEIGFSTNEAKVYVALTANNPMSGYDVAKHSGITRTMVYDILGRLLNKKMIICIENDPKLYEPIPYKLLFESLRLQYNNRIEAIKSELEKIETHTNTDNYIRNISDYEKMVQEIRNLINGASKELYISLWEEEAALFYEDIVEADKRGVKIISFSFEKLPYRCGVQYTYDIPKEELVKNWERRRIVVIVDRERIIIGEGDETIEEISVITNNTMLVGLAIDEMLLDIIHFHELKSGKYLPEKIEKIEQYLCATRKCHEDIGIDLDKMPKRAEQD